MRKTVKTYIITLVALLAFNACEDESPTSSVDAHHAYVYAEIAGQKEATSRAIKYNENDTYKEFSAADEIGIYALGPLYNKSGSNDTPVRNTKFTLGTTGKWQNNAQLIWNNEVGVDADNLDHADIYGYYPYKPHTDSDKVYKDGGYNIFTATNKLEDVLMAERTTVQYDNPAIFLTFKHRFALLKIELGTGMEGSPVTAGAVSAIMNLGIEDNAKIDNQELGQMRLTEKTDGIKEFKPIKYDDDFYYVIVPVEGQATLENSAKADDPLNRFVSDSLQVTYIKVDDVEFKLDNTFAPRINTIYSLTVHKGEGGSVSIVMGGIEEWGSERYLSDVREEGGIYWASDLKKLQTALAAITEGENGRAPDERDKDALSDFGEWDETAKCFIFPVMRNINMSDYANGNRSCSIKNFYGILDGRGYAINGLDITGPGLIGTLQPGSVVKDLELKNTTVSNTTGSTGALVGHAEEGSTIQNCSVTGTSAVKGGDNTGGLIGSGNPTINRSSSNADVSGGSNTGGLIGSLAEGGSINQSRTTGTVTATGNEVGGLAGSTAGPITNSHSGCDVTGKNNVGGLVGSTTDIIDGCTATGYINGETIVGGLAGTTTSAVNKSGANGTVSGMHIVGGLIGKHNVSTSGGIDVKEVVEITRSYARSAVSGGTVGGLIGEATPYKPEVQKVDAVQEKWTYYDASGNEVFESIVEIDHSKTEHLTEEQQEKWIYYDANGNEVFESTVEIAPDKTDHTEAVTPVEYQAPKGTEIKNCYATNGEVFAPNSDKGISYSYRIGTPANDDGDNVVYTISLTPTPPTGNELDVIIARLNTGSSDNPWVKGLVIIDNKSYTLPVLNYK